MDQLRALSAEGLPVYAECGGFMYLTERIIDGEGNSYPMTGLLPGRVRMGPRLRALGYCASELRCDSILGPRGTKARGHVFHWSALEGYDENEPRAFVITKGDRQMEDGFCRGSVLGGWVHHHFASNPDVVHALISAALRYRRTAT
jgi:cobyrinic acid a,c-diamide synthase